MFNFAAHYLTMKTALFTDFLLKKRCVNVLLLIAFVSHKSSNYQIFKFKSIHYLIRIGLYESKLWIDFRTAQKCL